jgi:hypothetical protein
MSEMLEGLTGKFPFAALLIGNFLQGALFLTLNGPLLFVYGKTRKVPTGLFDGYKNAAHEIASSLHQHDVAPFLTATVFIVLCLIVAQVIDPASKAIGVIVSLTLKRCKHSAFASSDLVTKEYPDYLGRLLRDPLAKTHWEWEMFHFYQRQSAVTSFFVWIMLLGWMKSLHFVWPPTFASVLEVIIALLLFISILYIYALSSVIMHYTHELYKDLPELPHKRSSVVTSDD